MTQTRRALLGTTLAVATAISSSTAFAGGLYFTDRGVRALGRGGAFVAGADDLGAIGYNPAGIVDAGTSVFADFTWLNFSSEYTRQTWVNDVTGRPIVASEPTVRGTSPFLPIPTLAASLALGMQKRIVIAAGIRAPYAAIANYPLVLDGQPSPSRYSLISLKGSLLVIPGVYIAWRPIPVLRIGVGFEVMTGTFASRVAVNASIPGNTLSTAEDPNYDAIMQLKAGPIVSPSGTAGMTFEPTRALRIGVSGQLPFVVNAPASIAIRLPNAAVYDSASQVGDDARVQFTLPAVARVGVEVRPTQNLRVEAAYVREFWSTHQSIDVFDSNVRLNNILGFPSSIAVPGLSVPRRFKDSNSFRLGGEYHIPFKQTALDVRAGVSYETSAIPTPYLSVLTLDLDKITASIGGSICIGEHWRFDAMYARVFTISATVPPAEAAIRPIDALQGGPSDGYATNGGRYTTQANLLGGGFRYQF